uniref:Uncharacterized protein n=1 Tax=Manihot esculenta TaxID=3983 RepID=A0A2C9W6R2_MANES
MTVGCFMAGAALFAVNVYTAPQQARIKARNDFVKERLIRKHSNG